MHEGVWFTPPALADYVVGWAGIRPYDRVLEPSAGNGALAIEIKKRLYGGTLVMVETLAPCVSLLRSMDLGEVLWGDFLTTEKLKDDFSLVIMNPPYDDGLDTKHLVRALEFAPRVVALLRLNALSGLERYEKIWGQHSLRRLAFLARRPRFSSPSGASGSPRHDFIIVDIHRGKEGNSLTHTQWVEL